MKVNPIAELRRFVRAALLDPVASGPAEGGPVTADGGAPRIAPAAPAESARGLPVESGPVASGPVESGPVEPARGARRRRIVVAATLVAGAACLGWALRLVPGDPLFPVVTLLLAAIWTAGALASGPLRPGRSRTRSGVGSGRGIVQSLAVGTLLLGVFLAGALLVAGVPALRDPVQLLLDHARYGPLALIAVLTVLNGIAEELFFRGALFAALPARSAVVTSAVASALATVASGVALLVLAAFVLGILTGLQRRVTGGVLAPVVTHLTWSLGMLFLLPYALDAGSRL